MSAKVLPFTGLTKLDIDPDQVLTEAVGVLENVTIVGIAKDGSFYYAASKSDFGLDLLMFKRAERYMMQVCDDNEADD
jgi:hypothetical protein